MSSSGRTSHREALLVAARTLLRERDYANITARELVAASGTNLGSIGYHFSSKDALLNEAIGQALEEWAQAIASATGQDPHGTALARMAATWRAVVDEFDQIRPYYLAFVEALPRSSRSPQLAEQLSAHYDRQRDRVAAMLIDAVGDTLAGDDARHLASMAIALVDGLMLQSFVNPAAVPSAADLARIAQSAFDAVRRDFG